MVTEYYAFIPVTTFLPCTSSCLRLSPLSISFPRIRCMPRRRVATFQMRGDRNRYSYRSTNRRSPFDTRINRANKPDFQKWARRAERFWEQSNSSERSTVALAAVGVVAAAGVAINVLFHVSLAFAFTIIPFIFAPILLTILASVSLFAILTFAIAGAGFFFVGTPFLAFGILVKALFPFAIVAGAAAFVANRFLGKGQEEKFYDSGSEYVAGISEVDEFEKFDEKLRYKGKPMSRKSMDVMSWDLSDVVDELDYKGLGEYRQLFIEERIDGRTLLTLTDDDIKMEFGSSMPLGDRLRLARLVSELRRQASRFP